MFLSLLDTYRYIHGYLDGYGELGNRLMANISFVS